LILRSSRRFHPVKIPDSSQDAVPLVITTIAVGNLVDNTGQEIPATEAHQDSAGLHKTELGADRERHDTNTVIATAGTCGLRFTTRAHQRDEI
jgi:hypothetical protein